MGPTRLATLILIFAAHAAAVLLSAPAGRLRAASRVTSLCACTGDVEVADSSADSSVLKLALQRRRTKLVSRQNTTARERSLVAAITGECPTLEMSPETAMSALWQHWYDEEGALARAAMEAALAEAAHEQAAALQALMEQYPEWAEPVNRLATLRYLQGDMVESLELCERVLQLKPWHFGALNSIVMCHAQQGDTISAEQWAAKAMPRAGSAQEKWVAQMVQLLDTRLDELEDLLETDLRTCAGNVGVADSSVLKLALQRVRLQRRRAKVVSRQNTTARERSLVAAIAGECPTSEMSPETAMSALWQHWYDEEGALARAAMEAALAEAAHEQAAALQALMEQYPEWAEPVNRLATLRYLQGDMVESLELCERVLQLKPWHFGALNSIVMCHAQQGGTISAEQWAAKAMPRAGSAREKWVAQMVKLLDTRLDELEDLLETDLLTCAGNMGVADSSVLKLALQRVRLQRRRAKVVSRQNTTARERSLVAAIAGECPTLEMSPETAMSALWQHWYDEEGALARAAMEAALAEAAHEQAAALQALMEQYPEWAEPVNRLATLRYLQGDMVESLELCERVLQLKPWHFGALNSIVMCHAQQGDTISAEQWAAKAMPRAGSAREKWVAQMVQLLDTRLEELEDLLEN